MRNFSIVHLVLLLAPALVAVSVLIALPHGRAASGCSGSGLTSALQTAANAERRTMNTSDKASSGDLSRFQHQRRLLLAALIASTRCRTDSRAPPCSRKQRTTGSRHMALS